MPARLIGLMQCLCSTVELHWCCCSSRRMTSLLWSRPRRQLMRKDTLRRLQSSAYINMRSRNLAIPDSMLVWLCFAGP